MDAVNWTALSALAAIFIGGFGWFSHQLTNRMDRLDARMDERFARVDERFDRLEERYVRHLELHATGSAP